MTLVQRLLILVGTVLAILIGIWLHAAVSVRDLEEQAIRSKLSGLISVASSDYDNFVERTQLVLTAVSVEAPRAVSDASSCQSVVTRLHASGIDWLRLDIVDSQGIARCSTVPEDFGKDMSNYPEVVAARTSGRAVVGNYVWGLISGIPTLVTAAPWIGLSGAKGVVAGSAQLDPFVQMLPALLPAGYSIILVDRSGRVLATDPPNRNIMGHTLPASLALLAQTSGPGEALTTWVDGSERFVSYAPATSSRHLGVFVAAGAVPNDEIGGGPFGYVSGLASLAAAIGAFFLAWWGGAHFIRRPLNELASVALRWRDGDQNARVTLYGRSETAELGAVLNSLADAKDQSDRQTRNTSDLLTALIESSQDAIWVTHLDGRVLVANSTFLELTHLTQDRAIGNGLIVPHDPDMHHALADLQARVIATSAAQSGDIFAQGPNATRRVLQTICAPIFDTQGSVQAVAGIGRDVTDSRASASALTEAKDKAETADRAKTRFLAAASHDLRQPLQASIMLADLAARRLQTGGEAEKTIESLCRALDDLKCLVESILDVSRLDAVQPEISVFPMQPLLDQIGIALHPMAKSKGIALLMGNTHAIVRSDRILLARMLTNIIENGIRYTQAGSVMISFEMADDVLRIRVEDTGIGISPNDFSRIWQEFEQLHNPGRDRRQGLGLGLSIVRRLAMLLAHPVELTSEPGSGSCFIVSLPLIEQDAVPADKSLPDIAVAPNEGNQLVVVIDDDPLVLDVLRSILIEFDFQVIAALNCEAAVRELGLAGVMPALIIVDYRLRDGYEGTDAIAAIRDDLGRWIPAIVLTGELAGDEVDRPLENATRVGATLLRKPVGSKKLLDVIRSATSAATV